MLVCRTPGDPKRQERLVNVQRFDEGVRRAGVGGGGATTLCCLLSGRHDSRGRFNPNDSPLCIDINTLGPLFGPALIPSEAQSPVFFLIRCDGLTTSQVI